MDFQLHHASYRYPFQEAWALREIDLRVEAGQAVLLTGPSGGGKSTLLRLLNGAIPHVHGGELTGRAVLGGREAADWSLREISRRVSTLHQDPERQFLALTVADEVAFALEWRLDDPAEIRRRCLAAAADFRLESVWDASIYALSEGQKQKVALASLAVLGPEALTLDEPTGNLDPASALELAGHLGRLKRAGATLIIADHRLAWLAGLIDHVYVIDGGRIVAEGPWSLLEEDALRRRYGLRALQWPQDRELPPCEPGGEGEELCWRALRFGYRGRPLLFDDADIALPRGGVTAMTGPNGCGKTTFARLLAGLLRPRGGVLTRRGRPTRPRDLRAATAMGMQNSELQLHQPTVLREALCAVGARRRRKGLTRAQALELLDRLDLADLAGRHPQSLSGGQKQRLVVACAAARGAELMILDEPTSGLDGGHMLALADLLDQRRAAGQSSLVITHDLELMARACTHELRLPLEAASPESPRSEHEESDRVRQSLRVERAGGRVDR